MNFKKLVLLFVAISLSLAFIACGQTTTEATTQAPTTVAPTTVAPTTIAPTTEAPTTEAPTTEAPTTVVQSTTLNILNGWVDAGDEVYTITQSDSGLSVIYNKNSFSWASMTYAITEDLSDFNKLVFTVRGSGTLMVKIQGATEAFEVSIQLTAGEVTYQLNLRDYDEFLGGVTQVVLFGGPGRASETGNFEMSKFEFDEGTAYGNVLESGDSNIPENELVYDGTGETFEISSGYADNGDGTYTIDDSGENPVISYTKAPGFEWAYLISTVRGDFSDFDYLVLKVKGITSGSLIFKAELSASVNAEVTGTYDVDEEVILCIDLTSWTDEQMDALTKVLIFADGGSASGSGSFEIMESYFSKVAVIQEDKYDFMTGWTEVDTGTYTFTTTVNETTQVDYTKAVGQGWALMRNDFTAEAEGYNTMTLTVKGTAGKSILVKPNDNGALEQTITFDGTEQTVVITADSFTNIIVFAEAGSEDVSGSFEIIEAKLTYVEPEPLAADVVYDIQDGWTDNDGGIYTFTNTDGVVTVDFSKTAGQEWAFIKNTFDEVLTNHNIIEMVVQGTIGQQLIIKPNDNAAYEQTVTFDGTEQTVTFVLTDAPVNIIMFVDPINGGLTGSFDILSAKVYSTLDGEYSFLNDFFENDPGTYDITEVLDGIQVDYTKVAGQEWSFMKAEFNTVIVDGFNTMTFVVNGTSGESILLKPNDNNALEQTITFDGTDQLVTVTADAFNNLIIFAAAGNTGTGTFTIKEATLSYVEPNYDFMTGWTEGDAGTYTFTTTANDTTLVEYTKAAGQEWVFMGNVFTVDAEGFNTMTFTVKGTAGKTILIKPNDDGTLEQTITFDGTEQTFVITVSAFTKMIIFAEGGTASVSGSFEIIEAKLTYVEPDAIPAYEDYTLGNEWVDNDGGIYTFTEDAGTVTVDFSKTAGQEWAYIIYNIEDNLENHDTLTMIVTGTIGEQILIKPNDNGAFEQTVTFDGTAQEVTFTLTEPLTKILIFVDPFNGGLTGSFDIVSAVVTSTEAEIDFTEDFHENDLGTYAISIVGDGSITVDYTKVAGQEWSFMNADFAEYNVEGLNTLTIVVQGTAGKSILIKPNDNGALEQTVNFDGTVQTIVITNESFNNIIIFAEGGVTDVSGTFTIVSATLSHTETE